MKQTHQAYTVAFGLPRGLPRAKRGQGLVEYSLILALIALVAVAALTTIGTSVKDALALVLPGL